MSQQQWVDVASVTRIEYGTRPATALLTFASPMARDEFLRTLCTARDVKGGGVRHDSFTYCLVHGTNHDGFDPARVA